MGHMYFETYGHCKTQLRSCTKPFNSMNPRVHLDYEKPAAPQTLVSFFEAMRRVNRVLLNRLVVQWEALNIQAASGLAKKVRDGRAFGDLAVQVHYGDREPGVWHNDALNSVLHLGMSVRGKRFLLSRQFEGGKPRTARVELAAGSVYLSSPALFKHAVEYPSSAYEERILAVQARFLLSVQEYTDLEEDWKKCGVRGQQEIADVMKCVLSANSLVLPTMVQVQDVLAE